MASSPLSASEYRRLLRDVQKFVQKARAKSPDGKLDAYWHIGRRIQEETVSQDVGYYGAVIKDLARDLRLSPRTLYDAVQFSDAHDAPPQAPALTWSHHRLLLRLRTKKDRAFYEKLTESENLTARGLESAITQGLHEGKKAPQKPKLTRPTDPEYLYRAKVLAVIDGDTLDLDIDLGFGVSRKLRARLAQVDCPEVTAPAGRLARDFVAKRLMATATVCVKTIKVDLHGRYVVHLFSTTNKTTLAHCFARGDYLNDVLLQEKHARVER